MSACTCCCRCPASPSSSHEGKTVSWVCNDDNAQVENHLQPSTDSKASQVGAPLVHLPDKGHGVWVCMPEELNHLQQTTKASAIMLQEGPSTDCLEDKQ